MEGAELAAVAGGLGAACVVLAFERWLLLAGFVLLGAAEAGLVLSTSGGDGLSAALVALGAAGLVPLAIGAMLFLRWPHAMLPTILAAAPFRPPLEFDSANRFYVGVAQEGELGRLLPLYGVLGAATLALAWRALRGAPVPRLPRIVTIPGAAFFLLAGASLTWSSDVDAGAKTLAFFLLPFAGLLAVGGRAPVPRLRVLAVIAVALACVFAAFGLWQAATHELFFFSPSVEVGNAFSSFFRVTSLFRDPSLYGRHVVLALAAFVGDRRLRLFAAGTAAVVLLGGAGLVAASVEDHSARRVTSDRSRRIDLTVEVIRDHPLKGVGLGAQPAESQARSEQGGSPRRFVSHTTPLTVAAELGVLGLVAYLAFLAGAAVLIPLLVHSLAYSGFFEDPITWVVVAVAAAALAILERSPAATRGKSHDFP